MARPRQHVCAEPGCPEIQAAPRCPTHTREVDRARGSRQERGYDAEHDRLRRWWKPRVDAGQVDCREVVCLEPARRILPGQPWHLCHDRTTGKYRGPGHVRCNTSEGGKAAHQ